MPLRFTRRILDHLAHPSYPASFPDDAARDLRVSREDEALFQEAIEQLQAQGRLETGPDGRLRLPSYGDEVVGEFRLNARGFGFVMPDDPYREGDLFIPRGRTRDAISGDRVRARVIRQTWRSKARSGRSPFIGQIEEVLERGREHFTGVLFERGGAWFVEPGGKSLYEPVLIRDPHVKGAKAGDEVVIELLHYPTEHYVPEGVIVRVLGEAGRPDVETEAIIVAHGLRTEFPRTSLDQAAKAARSFDAQVKAAPNREDLTATFTLTIDPPEARDFDDAISISHDPASDEWTLGVHIADVAHFVRPRSALDEEARQRGNSVYLPRMVVPMLPEVLSNGVCSLQEGVWRFAKSVFVTFDHRGKVLFQRLASTIISSNKRLTYLEAQALIDGAPDVARKHARAEAAYPDELIETLRHCDRLARILQKRRHRDGMIVLDLPQVELVFDEDGHVIDAVPEDDAFTHTIIEMFMVEANEAVARTFDDLDVPVLRRIHPDPVPGDIGELRMYARGAGLGLPDEPDRKDLQRLLDATRDTPAARAIHFAVLRTLATASYSPALIGHFALASDHYAHFTSPIRRYPDLTVHRALEAFLDATDNGRDVPGGRKRRELGRRLGDDDRVPDEDELVQLGRHCSDTEVEAEAAERELRDFLVMKFLAENHLGDEFSGVVTGITGGGLYVSIERFLVEGMVRDDGMPQPGGRADRWVADHRTGRLVAERSGASIGVGDIVTVEVLRVDLASRHLDLKLTALSPSAAREAPAPRRKKKEAAAPAARPGGKRKGSKQGRRGRKGR
ncbi:MAG: ribonuclease R family protein [Planctomycetota bacterium]|jgi:ribonuclease R